MITNDRIKGTIQNTAGKMQRKMGELAGDKQEQVNGIGTQIEVRAQKAFGIVKENINGATKDSISTRRPM